jgi:hypothetical protein
MPEKRLTALSADRKPTVVGSPEDLRMQENMDRGYEYTTSQKPLGNNLRNWLGSKLDNTQKAIYSGLAGMFADSPEVQNRNSVMGADMRAEMRNNAYKMGLMRARQSGNMSEENINRLVTEEMNKIGR